jgi:hypothetical protein
MALGRNRRRRGRSGGRRANYAPVQTSVGYRKYLPVGWANWLGFCLFGFICIALVAEVFWAAAHDRGADPIAAAIMALAFGYMVYLFGTNRITD